MLAPDETKLSTLHIQHLPSQSSLPNIRSFSSLQKDKILPSIKPEAMKGQLAAILGFQKQLAQREREIHSGTSQMMMALMVDELVFACV